MTTHPLIDALDAEGEREKEGILAAAGLLAEEIREKARREARSLLAVPSAPRRVRVTTPGSGPASAAFLHRYAQVLEELRRAVLGAVAALGPERRAEMLALLALEAVHRLGAGTYAVEGPAAVGREVGRRLLRTDVAVDWVPSGAEAVIIGAPDGSLRVEISFERLVTSYFAAEPGRVARLLLGDDAAL